MNICVNCGVELEDNTKICPLCGKDPQNKENQGSVHDNLPSDIIQLQKKENRKYLWELSGIIAFSGVAGCTIIDLLLSKRLTWSLLSDVSISAAWVILTLYEFIYKKTSAILFLLLITILVTLFLIDLITTGKEWFFPIALPVTIAVFISAGVIIILNKVAHFNGLNLIASSFILLSGFCILLEMLLDKFADGFVNLRWSLFVAVSILPVALVFFFYHYRLKKGNRLDSFFHI